MSAQDLASRLVRATVHLGPDELAVVVMIAERLAAGRRGYGDLHLATDSRDFRRETLEEAVDGLVYAACGLLRGDRC